MNRIKRARIVNGFTQKELADKLGVSAVQICKWENGKAFPAVKRLKQVADVLHTTVNDLLEEEAG